MATSQNTTLRRGERKKQILHLIRTTPAIGRTLVKQRSGYSMTSTLSLIDELIAQGLVVNAGKEGCTGAGRKTTLLEINPDGCYFIGVRFNAAAVTAVTLDFAHTLRDSMRIQLPPGVRAQALTEAVESAIETLLARLGDGRGRAGGIGVGASGIIDAQRGIIRRYEHVPDLADLPLRQMLEARFHIPVSLEHGVRCTARAVLAQPAYAGCRNLLLMQLDRGVIACIVAEGQIYSGSAALAGEIGHMRVAENGVRCECGHVGCLETVASGRALCENAERLMREGPCGALQQTAAQDEKADVALLLRLADAGDATCQRLLAEAGQGVGVALAASVALLNPDTVILSGQPTESVFFQQAVATTLRERCLPESLEAVRIDYRQRDPLFDACSAAALAYHERFGVTGPQPCA